MPTCLLGFLFFGQLDLVRDRLKRADHFTSGFFFFVQLDLVRDRLSVPTCARRISLVELDLVRDRLKRADLSSSGFLFFVQLELVCRSPEACRLTRLTFNSTSFA